MIRIILITLLAQGWLSAQGKGAPAKATPRRVEPEGWLGVQLTDTWTWRAGERFHLAEVEEVVPRSPAARAGLLPDDLVVSVNGRRVPRARDLVSLVEGSPPGTRLKMEVLREDQPLSLTATVGARPPQAAGESRTPRQEYDEEGSPESSPAADSRQITVNGRPLTSAQNRELVQAYGAAPLAGRYWYDPRSGLYGLWGREAAGFLRPGHNLGPLPAEASGGNTGIFINGRQINFAEAAYFQGLFGAVYPGRWWLDGHSGNVGLEGSPWPMANIVLALQQSRRSSRGSGGDGYRWHNQTGSGGAEGGCVWANVPGSGSYMSSGCD